jgi:hypothetical protein
MAVLLITYDVKKQSGNSSSFHKQIKHYFHIKLSESSYAIQTTEPTSYVYGKLKDSIEKNDRLYIITLDKPWSGFGPIENRDWLTNYF